MCDGDGERALSTALAYMSGYYKNGLPSRSLLSGQERWATTELRPDRSVAGSAWTGIATKIAWVLIQ